MTRLSPQRTGQLYLAAERHRIRALDALPDGHRPADDTPERCPGCGEWQLPERVCITCLLLTGRPRP